MESMDWVPVNEILAEMMCITSEAMQLKADMPFLHSLTCPYMQLNIEKNKVLEDGGTTKGNKPGSPSDHVEQSPTLIYTGLIFFNYILYKTNIL